MASESIQVSLGQWGHSSHFISVVEDWVRLGPIQNSNNYFLVVGINYILMEVWYLIS
jgi:hypothetical protein